MCFPPAHAVMSVKKVANTNTCRIPQLIQITYVFELYLLHA